MPFHRQEITNSLIKENLIMVEKLKCKSIYCKIKITEYRIEHEQ